MSRYYFDIHEDGRVRKDEEGVEIANEQEVRDEAQRAIPEIAYHEIPGDGDRKSYAVIVTDEEGLPVYSASLNYSGLWLRR